MRRRYWILILIVVLAGGFFALRAYGQSRQEDSLSSLQTVEAATGPLTASVGATGTVHANQAAILTFQTTGVVEEVRVAMGETVAANELLATLKQTSLPSSVILAQADLVAAQRALEELRNSEQAWASAQLALAQAQDALEDAEYIRSVRQEGNRASSDTLDAAHANLVLAQREVDQAEAAFERVESRPEDSPSRAIALSNLVAARQKRDSIQRNLNWYKGHPTEIEQALLDADVTFAEAQLADAQREWERVKDGPDLADLAAAEARVAATEATLELARITAPFSGTITSQEVKPGDSVGPGTVAFGLADLSRLLVDVDVSEVDINRIEIGQPVVLNFDAVLDREYQGSVTEIGLSGVSLQGVVNFKITVEVNDADEKIKPGMTAAVNIVVEQIEDALLVPNRAVRVRDGERVVYVMEGGNLEAVSVRLGVSSEMYSQVLEGDLQEGDRVVLNPPMVFDSPGEHPGFFGGGR
ncbi:MAG: efflux RND transporter periplasmic adaptor subunit [Anaerolineales bacterium]|nr:efflux RND transporter periplasmic adaptor subunit [Anaerolineales bacterium]